MCGRKYGDVRLKKLITEMMIINVHIVFTLQFFTLIKASGNDGCRDKITE